MHLGLSSTSNEMKPDRLGNSIILGETSTTQARTVTTARATTAPGLKAGPTGPRSPGVLQREDVNGRVQVMVPARQVDTLSRTGRGGTGASRPGCGGRTAPWHTGRTENLRDGRPRILPQLGRPKGRCPDPRRHRPRGPRLRSPSWTRPERFGGRGPRPARPTPPATGSIRNHPPGQNSPFGLLTAPRSWSDASLAGEAQRGRVGGEVGSGGRAWRACSPHRPHRGRRLLRADLPGRFPPRDATGIRGRQRKKGECMAEQVAHRRLKTGSRAFLSLVLGVVIAVGLVLPAGAHSPDVDWRWRAIRYSQVSETRTRVLWWLTATNHRSGYVKIRCRVKPQVRVEDAAGVNTWHQGRWSVWLRLRPGRTSSHGWWLAVDHPAGTATGWRASANCHAH
jgi:hypothetical protein